MTAAAILYGAAAVLAAASALVWMRIRVVLRSHDSWGFRPGHMVLSLSLVTVAFTAQALARYGVARAWTESFALVSFVGAVAFWFVSSLDLAEGHL